MNHQNENIRGRRFFRWTCQEFEHEDCNELLREEGFRFNRVPQVPGAWFEHEGPFALGGSLANYFGLMYIQDLASMLPALLLNPCEGSRVLDMCASPGGKTAQLSEMSGKTGLVVANEPNSRRNETLRANVNRLNLVNVAITGYEGQVLPGKDIFFDYILVDAPCSGWGTVDKHPEVLKMWTDEKTGPLIELQKRLLISASELLSPGGTLVYSTCTTNEQENRKQVEMILDRSDLITSQRAEKLRRDLALPGLRQAGEGMLNFDGRKMGAQSFFMAALEKPGKIEQATDIDLSPPHNWEPVDPGVFRIGEKPRHAGFYVFRDRVFVLQHEVLPYARQGLKVRGYYAGKRTGRKFLLSPRLRVFGDKNPEKGYRVDSVHEARGIVSGQSIYPPGSTEAEQTGFYFRDLLLGWLKAVRGRVFWSEK